MPLTPGTALGQYEIRGALGAGGMGEVYRAYDNQLEREVAIKVLPESLTSDPERLRRFEQEARAAAALNHPNILAVYQMGKHGNITYMVTELLDGETLRERLRRGPIPLRKAIDIAVQIAHGLAAAHDKGIMHRDLKPENLFVTKDGRVKILDFGLAKVGPSKDDSGLEATQSVGTEPGMVMGTVGYMSPEQVRGKTADHRSDIFAFGTILYEMATGKQTFRKPTSAETMTAILNEDPQSISQIAPASPPGLQRVVHRCLEKSPEQRFQSASDMAFALEALSDSGSSSVVAMNQGSRSRWVWVAGTAVIVAVAAAMIAWWRTPPAAPVVELVAQLTDDGEPKAGKLVSDGSRVYFNEGPTGSWKIAQVSVSGGRTASVDTTVANPGIVGMASDGSGLLALVRGPDFTGYPVWSIPLPAGEPRRLGNADVQGAGLFPDGRVLLVIERDLYIADKDGSNPRKLFSAAGNVGAPSVSPDGRQIVFATIDASGAGSLVELAADGAGSHTIVTASLDEKLGDGAWSSDGKYFLYRIEHGRGSDLWALPMQTGIFHRSTKPIRLTNGPLLYFSVCPSRDGKQIFAIGTKRRGELVRYDMQSHQFVPFLSGISAIDTTFSQDGQWVTYVSYPDHSLWRSRSDGTERKQLTYPPMEVAYPSISPDGTKATFETSNNETFMVSMEGGVPQKIERQHGDVGTSWSPDGNFLILASFLEGKHLGDKNTGGMQTFDVRTGKTSPVLSTQVVFGVQWINQDTLVAANDTATKFLTYDFKTQKWSDLVVGNFTSWYLSPDRKFLYFTTGGADPNVKRLRVADHQIETITSLKNLRRVVDSVEMGGTQVNVAPDGSPVFTRDIGSQEIYALTVKWP